MFVYICNLKVSIMCRNQSIAVIRDSLCFIPTITYLTILSKVSRLPLSLALYTYHKKDVHNSTLVYNFVEEIHTCYTEIQNRIHLLLKFYK